MNRRYEWNLFTVFNVKVTLHLSLLFLILYVFIISTAQFPEVVKLSKMDPSKITGSPSTWGFLFTFSLIFSIFIHELSHALLAQRYGSRVKKITLMMLGGTSELESFPPNPSVEWKVSLIGPLVSLAIGFVLITARHWIRSESFGFFGYWVGQLNLVLGVFNLLPAFPTDGGRILRALLEKKQGSLRGTRNAVKISHFFSFLFMLLGLLQFNFILLLIAGFIALSSRTEWFAVLAKHALAGLTARDLLIKTSPISETAPISEAANTMLQQRLMLLPVSSEQETMVIEAEQLQKFDPKKWDQTPVVQAETPARNIIDADSPLENALHLGLSNGLKAIPVRDHRQIIGVIRLSDLMDLIQLRQLTGTA